MPFLGTRTIVGAPAFHVEDTHVESVVFSRSFGFAVTQFDVRGRGTVKSSVPRTRGRPVRGRSAGLRGLAGPVLCERDEKKSPARRGPRPPPTDGSATLEQIDLASLGRGKDAYAFIAPTAPCVSSAIAASFVLGSLK